MTHLGVLDPGRPVKKFREKSGRPGPRGNRASAIMFVAQITLRRTGALFDVFVDDRVPCWHFRHRLSAEGYAFLTHFRAKGTRFWCILVASQPTSQPATQPASRPASMSPPVGWAGKVTQSVRFRTKINTILADHHFRISLKPNQPFSQPFQIVGLAKRKCLCATSN